MTAYALPPLINGDVINIQAITPPPTPPTGPSPVGTIVTDKTPLTVANGDAYALNGNPGQIIYTAAGKAPVTVASSALVVALMVVGVSSSNPTGLVQFNTSNAVWTVAMGNNPGTFVANVPGKPLAYTPGAILPYGTLAAPLYSIQDFQGYLPPSRNGSQTSFASWMPTPGGGVPFLSGNPETQFYVDPTIAGNYNPFSTGSGGSLIITATPGDTVYGDVTQTYKSGCMISAGSGGVLFGRQYGVFSTRTRMVQDGDGAWPADWYLPLDNNFQYTGEPDAMEMWNDLPQYHCGMAGGVNGFAPDLALFPAYRRTDFHNYTLVFGPSMSAFYCDGMCVSTAPTPAGLIGKTLYLLMNLAIGKDGSWVGTPDGKTFSRETSDFHFYPLPVGAGF